MDVVVSLSVEQGRVEDTKSGIIKESKLRVINVHFDVLWLGILFVEISEVNVDTQLFRFYYIRFCQLVDQVL